MENIETKEWDSAGFLVSEKEILNYLNACFEEYGDDPLMIAHALNIAARARDINQAA